MKKTTVISLIMVVAIVIGLLAGCGPKTDTPPATDTPTPETRTPITLRLSHGMIPDFSIGVAATAFKEKMAELSGGTVTIDVYDSASLGADVVTTEYCMMGDLDFATISSFAFATTAGIDQVLLYDLPWHLKGNEDYMLKVVNGDPAYKTIFTDLAAEKNLKVLAFGHIGGYGFGGTTKITKVEDMNGKKMRTAENAMVVDLFNSIGAKPVVINIGEVYSAIQQGVCDGIYSTLTMMYMYKTYEMATEVVEYDNAWCYTFLVMNLEKFNAMDAELQGWVLEAAALWQDTCLAQEKLDRQTVIDDMAAKNATYAMLTAEEKDAFSAACEPVRTKWRDVIGADLYDSSVDFVNSLG